MAVLLNDVSSLRFRLELTGRVDPGVSHPAAVSVTAALERFAHRPLPPDAEPGTPPAHGFEPVLDVGEHVVLDLDVIRLIEEAERVLSGAQQVLQFQPLPPDVRALGPKPHGWERGDPSQADEVPRPPLGLQVVRVPGGVVVEVGLDLAPCLAPVAGLAVPSARDFALFRFATTLDALRGFALGLSEEYARFPTDPGRIDPGPAA